MDSPMDLPAAVVPGVQRPRWPAHTLRTAAGLAVALLFLGAFVRLVNVSSVAQRLQHLRPGLAVLCGLVFLSAYVVRALRWRRLLAPHRVGVLRVVALYQVAIFVNWLLPLRGGELLKCLLLRRLDALPLSRSLPTVTMDKAMDLLPALGLLLIVAAHTAVAVGLDALFCWLAFGAVGAALAFPVVLYGYTFYNLAYLLPTPPGQIGSNELIGLLVFGGLCGINRAAVAAMFLFSHPWTALLMSGSGMLSLSAMGLSVRQTLALAHSPGDRRQATGDRGRAAGGTGGP